MSAEINYKNKYMELRSKYMADLDTAFRLGFEQGGMQEQQNQMMQQQADAQAVQEAALQGQNGQPGQPGQPGEGAPGQEAQPGEQPPSEHPEGSELDQHIAKLESMIAKSENDPAELKKSFDEMKKIQKNIKEQYELKKSVQAIRGIAKALHKPAFKLSKQASINLPANAKAAVSMQHKIVNDVMAKMEAEEKRASADIKTILADLTKE